MFWIGVRYFTSAGRMRNVLYLTITSLSLNIGVLIAGVSLIRGFEREAFRKILHVSGHAKVYPYRELPKLTYSNDPEPIVHIPFLQEIRRFLQIKTDAHPNLVRMRPKLEMWGVISRKKRNEGVMIHGVSNDNAQHLLSQHIKKGEISLNMQGNLHSVIIGDRLADTIGANVGSDVNITVIHSKDETETVNCRVAGIFNYGFAEFDSNMIYISDNLIQELGHEKPRYGILYIDQPNKIDEYTNQVNLIDESLEFESWKEQNKLMYDMFNTQLKAIYVLLGLYILSSIIQSLSSLYMLLSERMHDLSILTMLGMSSWQKYSIFASYGILISLTNAILGIIFGTGLSALYPYIRQIYEQLTGLSLIHKDVFWLADFTTELLWSDIITIGLATFITMLISMLIAAYFISNVNTVRSLRE